jgi:nucleoid-associated protein YgaU
MAKKKGILDQAIDALTTRDEVQAADEAKKEAEAARAEAARETTARRAAEAKAAAAEAKAKAAQAEAEAAKKAAAEAKRQTEAAAHREQFRADMQRQAAERQAREAQARLYVVKAGDSLSKIAKEVLGDARRWPEIFEANKDQIKDPNLIRVGQELKIPPK